MKSKACATVLALCIAVGGASAAPKVSIADARKAALARVPGTIMHEKLEHAKQGHDHYNIKIKPRTSKGGAMWKKVEVDAETGRIVEVKDTKPKSYK
jgi:uncharacterized membrane protein YkoI